MTRWIVFGVVVIAASVVVTIGFPYLTAGSGKVESLIPESAPIAPTGPRPKLTVIGTEKFDFGTMTQQDSSEHDFEIKNDGQGDLILTAGTESSTCSCTVVELPEKLPEKRSQLTIKPGASGKIKVSWQTKEFSNDFERAVYLETNDPETPKAKFAIGGKIFPAITMIPGETTLNFMTPNNSKDFALPVVLFSQNKADLKVTDVVTTNPAVLSHSIRPLNDEEKKRFEIKEGGVRVDVIVKKGANLGPFSDEVLIKTNHPKKPELKFTALGRVEGPISMAPRWGVQMREVSSKRGGSSNMTMWVRDQPDTKFEVVKKPAEVDVEITPAAASEADKPAATPNAPAAKGKKYDFVVRVKPNTPTGAVTDEILIKTNHPNAPLLRVPVQVFVNSNG